MIGQQVGTLTLWLRELERHHGGMRAAAEAHGIDPGYWSRMSHGEKSNPSPDMLERLGLREVATLYARSKP